MLKRLCTCFALLALCGTLRADIAPSNNPFYLCADEPAFATAITEISNNPFSGWEQPAGNNSEDPFISEIAADDPFTVAATTVPVRDTRPMMTIYSPVGGCGYCEQMKKMDFTRTPFQVKFRERDIDGWQYPRAMWQKPDGGWVQATGLRTAEQLEDDWWTTAGYPGQTAPTPYSELPRIVATLSSLNASKTFTDLGCGDGRVLIAAVKKYGCRGIGIEIDPQQAEKARENVAAAGLSDRIEIIEGDLLTTEIKGDVGYAYLYPDLLEQLKPKLTKMEQFVTYQHRPANLPVLDYGGVYVWTKPQPQPVRQQPQPVQYQQGQTQMAYWQGQYYSGRVCSNPRCAMCNSIQRQLVH